MTNKDKVFNELRIFSEKYIEIEGSSGVTANEIAEVLGLQRNIVSQYLNEACRRDIALKTNTRPVYFWNIEVLDKKRVHKEELVEEDPFVKLIGWDGSLKEQVEQCKAAAVYPTKGLPITLTGNSGVGKSYIASVIYEYAVFKGCLKDKSPFITFNCADYANNPELLSANLFGHKKGAFTGADKDSQGLIEAADGGYLFLDEVHRLGAEGQEKLFLFLDKGKFRRMGESDKWRSANVRFIFATTEDLDEVLLDTFRRRIPIFVDIPSLDKRTVTERLNMIYSFYLKESKEINRDLIINKNVINALLSIKGNGNIGLLKNTVISSCANAYRNNINKDTLEIEIRDFPVKYKEKFKIEKNFYDNNMKVIRSEEKYSKTLVNKSEENKVLREEYKNLLKLLQGLNTGNLNEDKFKKLTTASLNKILNDIAFNKNNIESDIITYELVFKIVENSLNLIQQNYGIKYHGNTSKLLTYSVMVLRGLVNLELNNQSEIKLCKKILKKKISKSYLIGKRIAGIISTNLDEELGDLLDIYMTLFINSYLINNKTNCNAIIVAHGFSTASSIASVANTCFEEFIFEPFDMPIDVSTSTVVKNIKEYLVNLNTDKGTIVLVDMGSLTQIYEELKIIVSGDIGVINNISTQLALDVANKILNNESIEAIVKEASNNNKTEYMYYKAPNKKKAIVVTCISGIGTAEKLREILTKCIGDADIEIIPQEYSAVNEKLDTNKVFKEYDVKLIITTTPLIVDRIPVIELQNLINKEGENYLAEILEGVIKKKSIGEIRDDIIKFFSLQNILNQLTILNPNKIIEEVEKILSNYEFALNMKFQSDLKLALFIHIGILIERLVLRDEVKSHPNEEKMKECHSDFIKVSEEIFEEVTKEYKVSLPLAEIVIIHEIISSRMMME